MREQLCSLRVQPVSAVVACGKEVGPNHSTTVNGTRLPGRFLRLQGGFGASEILLGFGWALFWCQPLSPPFWPTSS